MRETAKRGWRNDQSFTCTRRHFLPALLREALVTLGMLQGRQGERLSELGSLPDEQLGRMRPVVNPAYDIVVEGGQVWARHREFDTQVRLFHIEDMESLEAFNLFNGQSTLEQIGRRLAEEKDRDEALCFAHAKELFLSLASHLVCVPRDPPSAVA